jgi:hypothetical protein
MNWRQLIEKFVHSQDSQEEETYQKPHRRNVTNVHIASQTGSAAIRPGEIPGEVRTVKLCFVVDSSGSMSTAIEEMYSNIANLLKQYGGKLVTEFILIKFSDDFHIFKCKVAGNDGWYQKIHSLIGGKEKPGMAKDYESGNLKQLFSKHYGSGTSFSPALVKEIMYLVHKQYNILVATDSDILWQGNVENLRDLYKTAKKALFIVAANKECFANICSAFKEIPGQVTHM